MFFTSVCNFESWFKSNIIYDTSTWTISASLGSLMHKFFLVGGDFLGVGLRFLGDFFGVGLRFLGVACRTSGKR